MEIKTIEQIKEEVSKELLHPYRTWIENARFSNDDNVSVLEDSGAIDEAMTRYASQFQTNSYLITTEICVLRERVLNQEKHLCVLHELIDHIQNHEVNMNDKIDRLINIALHKISKIK